MKKISILSYDLSHNCLLRAYIIAKLLQRQFEVEIIGPKLGKSIWYPIQHEFPYKTIPKPNIFNLASILKSIDGDLVYAIKPKFTSYGLALIKKIISRKKVILDIDDWELGLFLGGDNKLMDILKAIKNSLNFRDYNNFLSTFLLEKLIIFADSITVSSTFLQKKFGGEIIPHTKINSELNLKNNQYNCKSLKSKLNLTNKKIILFAGTPRKHKGIDQISLAISKLNHPNLELLLVGVDFKDPYTKELKRLKNTTLIGQISIRELGKYLAIADIIILPQRDTLAGKGQMPAKIYDAMVMAKPIISTNISDIPLLLKGCGLIVEPEDIISLANKIKYLIEHPKIARALARKSRAKYLKEYSPQIIRPRLVKIIEYQLKNEN